MDFLPIFLNIRQQPCIVVGGGEVAARKVALLLKAGANVTVIAPRLVPSLHSANIHHVDSTFREELLDGAKLDVPKIIIAATDDHAVNLAVHAAATARGILVNVVDTPALCTFVMPAVIDRSPIIVAVSSGGAAPVLARMLRARLETLIPAGYGRLATLASKFRDQVKQKLGEGLPRRAFWEHIFEGSIGEDMLAGREQLAEQRLQQAVEQAQKPASGEVYLVGAGPGDPDLLTFRALRLMQKADVVLYDNLVSEGVMELVRREAERIYVGKKRAEHTMPQEGINDLLVRLALEGKRVLRLKGGDPFIFGRGGEEIEKLAENGIPFQVVPGVSAANGVASYSGIPLTHRDYAQSVIFTTGHLRDDSSLDLDWVALARPQQTVVIYMGLTGLAEICRQLIAHGLPSDWPAAVVQQGTTRHQRVITATLADLAQKVEATGLKAPTITIVGEVVKLRDKLSWFEPD
jgi:uroporphyrin-III C-methyltransferase/precorrin-2 dehydrogenase/sirohydrochlorin ferrochelatase